METEPPESGFDELMRLSQQFTRQQEEHEEKERQRAEQGKKVRGVLDGLRELNMSMAMEQLQQVATPEIIKEVNALKNKPGTDDLRKVISNLAEDLESRLRAISSKNTDAAPLVNAMRTLNILMDLYFSLQ
jgi:flagellar biosynthesis/type III secretory pathway protein FliH